MAAGWDSPHNPYARSSRAQTGLSCHLAGRACSALSTFNTSRPSLCCTPHSHAALPATQCSSLMPSRSLPLSSLSPGQVLQLARGVPHQPAVQPPHGAALPFAAGGRGAGRRRRRHGGGWDAGARHGNGAHPRRNTGSRGNGRSGGGSSSCEAAAARRRRCVGCQLRGC